MAMPEPMTACRVRDTPAAAGVDLAPLDRDLA